MKYFCHLELQHHQQQQRHHAHICLEQQTLLRCLNYKACKNTYFLANINSKKKFEEKAKQAGKMLKMWLSIKTPFQLTPGMHGETRRRAANTCVLSRFLLPTHKQLVHQFLLFLHVLRFYFSMCQHLKHSQCCFKHAKQQDSQDIHLEAIVLRYTYNDDDDDDNDKRTCVLPCFCL